MTRRDEDFRNERRRRASMASSYYGVSRALINTKKTTDLSRKRQRDFKKRERQKAIRGFLAFCLTIALVVVGAITQIYFDDMYVSFDGAATVNRVVKDPDYDKILGLVKGYFFENPAQRGSFLLDERRLNEYIQNRMPEILSVSITKAGLFESAVKVSLREPLARYGNRFVDEHGVIFSENFFREPDITMIDSNGMITEGVSSKFLSFVGQVISELKLHSEVVERVEIPRGAMRYVEFYLVGVNYPFKAQIDREAFSQASDIFNMKNYLSDRGILPLYADMRIEGKGYYK